MTGNEPSPRQLALWAIAGTVIAASVPLFTFVNWPRVPTSCDCSAKALFGPTGLQLLVFLSPLLCGLTISLVAEKQLKQGVENSEWSGEQLEAARSVVDTPIWILANGTALLSFLIVLILRSKGMHDWLFLNTLPLPWHTAMRLQKMLTPPKVLPEGWWSGEWPKLKPIQSDHLGEAKPGDGHSIFSS